MRYSEGPGTLLGPGNPGACKVILLLCRSQCSGREHLPEDVGEKGACSKSIELWTLTDWAKESGGRERNVRDVWRGSLS